jgi:hypothetical protein
MVMNGTAMHPDTLDYSLIDQPLRSLVRDINRSHWARTLGCCAGNACHEAGNFYILVGVRGLDGVNRFTRWLTLARAAGWEECINNPSVSAFALPDAEIVVPGNEMADDDWVTFDMRFQLGDRQPDAEQTAGGIRALELGWNAIAVGHT